MKQFLAVSVLLVAFTVGSVVSAQVASSTLPDPGTLPDSPLYFLKSWKEGVQLFFTFGAEKKAEQYLHLAEVRLAEYEKMLEKGKEDIAERTLEKYENQLNRALQKAEELKEKGEEAGEALKVKAQEATQKHVMVLERNLEKVSESAREGIERALEESKKQLEKLDDIFDEEFEGLLNDDEDEGASATVSADWKKYRNDQLGYEVKYPVGWNGRLNPTWDKQFIITNPISGGGFSVTVTADVPALGNDAGNNGIASAYKIDWLDAREIYYKSIYEPFTDGVLSIPASRVLWTSYDGKFYTVKFFGEDASEVKGEYAQILSTFKLISSSSRRTDLEDLDNLLDDAGLEDELDDLLEGLE
ncbi:MAG: DUF5667 domain-containing protein [Candidatus Brennerbacteria bacterium]